MGRRGFPSNRISCFNCGGPHIRRYCSQLKQGIMNMKVGAAQHRRRGRSPTKKITFVACVIVSKVTVVVLQ